MPAGAADDEDVVRTDGRICFDRLLRLADELGFLLLPPQVFAGSYGLRVAPNTALNVCDPAPNSGVFVLPTVMAPAARILVTMSASRVGT